MCIEKVFIVNKTVFQDGYKDIYNKNQYDSKGFI